MRSETQSMTVYFAHDRRCCLSPRRPVIGFSVARWCPAPGEAWYRGERGLVTTHGSREGRLGAGSGHVHGRSSRHRKGGYDTP